MDRVPKTINVIPNIFIFLSLITIFDNIATNVLALGAVADFGAQICQYTTKVDAR